MYLKEFRKQISTKPLQELPALYIFSGPHKQVSDFKEKAIQEFASYIANDNKKPSHYAKEPAISIKRFQLADFREAEFWDEVYAVPFLNIPKLVILNLAERINFLEQISGPLKEFISGKSFFTKLLFLVDYFGDCPVSLKGVIEKKSYVVDFPQISEENLPEWIVNEFNHHGKKISRTDARALVQRVGDNINEIDAVIQKLLLYHKDNVEITSEAINNFVDSERDYDIKELSESILRRQPDKALVITNQLLRKGEPVPKILGYLRWFFNYKAQYQKDTKLLSNRLGQILESDLAVKTGLLDEEMALQVLVIKLCRQSQGV